MNSHSTMYLLKLHITEKEYNRLIAFTFHHVSIKTQTEYTLEIVNTHSHSTMYLLKHNGINRRCNLFYKFTFHHVSIKTSQKKRLVRMHFTFTFHHVSIKTFIKNLCKCFRKNIHIPPCIY